MHRFIVESKHTEGNCVAVVREVHNMGYLNHFEWGCDAGVHCGWALIEAENESEALLSVPLIVRPQARAIRLVKFSKEDFNRTHPTS
jgi:hypothetical protein